MRRTRKPGETNQEAAEKAGLGKIPKKMRRKTGIFQFRKDYVNGKNTVADHAASAKEAEEEFKRDRRNRRKRLKTALRQRAKKASKLHGSVKVGDRPHAFKDVEIESEEAREAKAVASAEPSKAPDFIFQPCVPLIPDNWDIYKIWLREGREPIYPLMLPPRVREQRVDKMAARQCHLTVERFAQIVNDIAKGSFKHVAIQAAGINPQQAVHWERDAAAVERGLLEGDDPYDFSPTHLTFWHFSKAVREAEGKARRAAEQITFLMDPRFWLRFGPGRDRGPEAPGWTERVEHVGKDGKKLNVMTIEDLVMKSLPAPSEENNSNE